MKHCIQSSLQSFIVEAFPSHFDADKEPNIGKHHIGEVGTLSEQILTQFA